MIIHIYTFKNNFKKKVCHYIRLKKTINFREMTTNSLKYLYSVIIL